MCEREKDKRNSVCEREIMGTVCMCLCVREREREKDKGNSVCERKRWELCVSVCVRERERERSGEHLS